MQQQDVIIDRTKAQCEEFLHNINILKSQLASSNSCSSVSSSLRILRYEDVAYHSISMIGQIYDFLGLVVHPNVLKWMRGNLEGKVDSGNGDTTYLTKKDSLKTAEAWRKHLPYDLVRSMDRVCSEALMELGYKSADDI